MTKEKDTLSTEEAMAILKVTRKSLIETGLAVAIRLCREEGSTHSRRVFTEMEKMGVAGLTEVGSYWLSAIFRRPTVFKWTGEWYLPTLADYPSGVLENCSTDIRPVRVWGLTAA